MFLSYMFRTAEVRSLLRTPEAWSVLRTARTCSVKQATTLTVKPLTISIELSPIARVDRQSKVRCRQQMLERVYTNCTGE